MQSGANTDFMNLHSIMVQLLYLAATAFGTMAEEFTFHYGSITISVGSGVPKLSTLFTFHYGSITIFFLLPNIF